VSALHSWIYFLEKELFPETTKAERRRRAHWRHCDFAKHYRERAADAGVYWVARQMRRQGWKLELTVSVLATKGRP